MDKAILIVAHGLRGITQGIITIKAKYFTLAIAVFCCIWLTALVNQPSLAQLPESVDLYPKIERFSPSIQQSNVTGTLGNLDYTTVRIDGRPIFLIAVPGNIGQKSDELITPAEHRKQAVESKLKEIIQRGFDPETLTVTSSILNGLTVIQVGDDQNLRPQILRTITSADAQLYAQSVEDLAQQTVEVVRTALLQAWQERQPAATQKHITRVLVITAIVGTITLVLLLIYRWLGHRIRLLKAVLDALIKSQSQQADPNGTIDIKTFDNVYQSLSHYPLLFRYLDQLTLFIYYFFERSKKLVFGDGLDEKLDGSKNQPKHSVRHGFLTSLNSRNLLASILEFHTLKSFHHLLKNRLSQLVFARRLVSFFSVLVWIRGAAFSLQVFPDSRWLGMQLAGTPISLALIWFCVLILIKVTDYLINLFFQTLEEDFSSLHQTHYSRQQARAHTISGALRGNNIVLCVFGGLVASLSLFDIPVTTILAGAGILGFAISFGSQSIIKDLIAGISNLINDSFAVDDFVIIGEFSGTVENMNLFVTRIRCSNGDLVTIPNGTISTVCNQTKDWSRVDFVILVAADTDLQKAIAILDGVALDLYHDPLWAVRMLEVPDFKGVEDISHQGIRLRLWLKTLPGEQWAVARELRFRVKGAFEAANIAIGIPQQKWVMEAAPVIGAMDSDAKTPQGD